MARFAYAPAFGAAALLLAAAAPAADAPIVRTDIQAAAEQEGYAAFLYGEVAAHARSDGFGVLAGLLDTLSQRNGERARLHQRALGGDRLVDDLRAAAGTAIAQHEAYAKALQHARAVRDEAAAAEFERLFAESARDRDALQTAIDARTATKP